jgi:aspartyl-tRNA(Asn)/glutamyl-tRNA(Gln) amidotransferase subunit A
MAYAAMASDTSIHDASLAEAAAYLRARQVSSIELTRALLSRIENVDSRLHAYAAVTPKR